MYDPGSLVSPGLDVHRHCTPQFCQLHHHDIGFAPQFFRHIVIVPASLHNFASHIVTIVAVLHIFVSLIVIIGSRLLFTEHYLVPGDIF